jgi:uncharacterized membrane protein YphA (DoxX/SURF4 family)
LFTTFPDGAPGFGLLLLRLGVAAVLADHSAACLIDGPAGMQAWVVGVVAGVTAVLLVLGLCTPLGGAMAAATAVGFALSVLPSPARPAFGAGPTALAIAMAAAASAFTGPGAYSMDAALFGRREITIPRRAHEE